MFQTEMIMHLFYCMVWLSNVMIGMAFKRAKIVNVKIVNTAIHSILNDMVPYQRAIRH